MRHLLATAVVPEIGPSLIVGLVWRWLDNHHDCRPTVGDVASYLGLTERQLRKYWRERIAASSTMPLRLQVTYGCVTFAMREISNGAKCAAAVRVAGFKSSWNFNRQAQMFGLGTASEHRNGAKLQLSVESIETAVARFRLAATTPSNLRYGARRTGPRPHELYGCRTGRSNG